MEWFERSSILIRFFLVTFLTIVWAIPLTIVLYLLPKTGWVRWFGESVASCVIVGVAVVLLLYLFIRLHREAVLRYITGPDVLMRVSPRDLEHIVYLLFKNQGCKVTHTAIWEGEKPKPDGGADLVVVFPDKTKAVVQCKRWLDEAVDVNVLRELIGVMTVQQATRAIFVTTSTFSQPAIDLARSNSVELIDHPALWEWITKSGLQKDLIKIGQGQAIPNSALIERKTKLCCAFCGEEMVLKEKEDGPFLACSAYFSPTQCRNIVPVRDARRPRN